MTTSLLDFQLAAHSGSYLTDIERQALTLPSITLRAYNDLVRIEEALPEFTVTWRNQAYAQEHGFITAEWEVPGARRIYFSFHYYENSWTWSEEDEAGTFIADCRSEMLQINRGRLWVQKTLLAKAMNEQFHRIRPQTNARLRALELI